MAKNRFPMGGGMGGAQFNQMMKQAQKMQQDMIKMQEELDTMTCEASSGGGMVTVAANAKKEITAIKINPEAVDPDDVEMLQDMVIAAVNEALRTAETDKANQMSRMTGGLNLGGLF